MAATSAGRLSRPARGRGARPPPRPPGRPGPRPRPAACPDRPGVGGRPPPHCSRARAGPREGACVRCLAGLPRRRRYRAAYSGLVSVAAVTTPGAVTPVVTTTPLLDPPALLDLLPAVGALSR